MHALRFVSVTAALALCHAMSGCGSDEKDSGGGGATGGVTHASTGGAPNATGGNAGTGGLAGSSASGGVSSAQCIASHFSDPAISGACKSCMCECNAAVASTCDESCWSLTRCVRVDCAGNASDIACIMDKCALFLGGAQVALPLTSCFTKCGPTDCASWFLTGGIGGADGNAGAGGNGESGGVSGGNGGNGE